MTRGRGGGNGNLKRGVGSGSLVRIIVEVGHVAGRLSVRIGACFGSWFIGIRRLP